MITPTGKLIFDDTQAEWYLNGELWELWREKDKDAWVKSDVEWIMMTCDKAPPKLVAKEWAEHPESKEWLIRAYWEEDANGVWKETLKQTLKQTLGPDAVMKELPQRM